MHVVPDDEKGMILVETENIVFRRPKKFFPEPS